MSRLLLVFVAAWPACAGAADAINFTRDVRPILANNCFACHGPDAAHREGDLRLDIANGAGDVRGGAAVIKAGQPNESEVIARILSDDADKKMPPADSGKALKPEQIEILRRWVEQGGEYSAHWAFVPPVRTATPAVRNKEWVRNPIDAFILARLEREGLAPSLEARRETLIRRLSLDLTGLPPTPEDVAAFVVDQSPEAVDQLVERLLASPRLGERMAGPWLDAARYADSDGFEKDKPRFVWTYRQWVIDSLNDDLPYDQFIIDQIAGDLLPDATQDTLVATGFLRNSMINEEGGIDPEQFRMEAMFDRMDAIGKGILGLTIQCAQCHTHKYDPLTHLEYYGLFAFVNNSDEGSATVYTKDQLAQRAKIIDETARIESQLKASLPDWRERMRAWEESVRNDQPQWTIVRPELDASGGQKHYVLDDGSILAAGYAPTKHTTDFTIDTKQPTISALKLELLNDPNLPHGGPGRSIYGLFALSEFRATAAPLDKPDQKTDLKFISASADANPVEHPLDTTFHDKTDKVRVTGPIGYAVDGNDLTAWTPDIGPGRSNVPHNAVFLLDKPLSNPAGYRITFRLTQMHGGWNSDDNQNNNLGRFRFSVTDAQNPSADPVPAAVREILAIPDAQRTPAQIDAIFHYWRTTQLGWQSANAALEKLWQSHPKGASQLVLHERVAGRNTHRLNRGDFLKPAEAVTPTVPAFLHALPDGPSPSRLSFARWLADPKSPTTARSIVNRAWQGYFGTGLVSTSEDFGVQGDAPTHPELLDWLAVELMENGWSLKHLHRLIATSATYRQSSQVTPELLARDPDNRLLARGPRQRVSAETVRDIALAASGLLQERIGGPSVHPPAPEFLFKPPASYGPKTWHTDDGADRYRRGVYTFRFRSVPYPMLQTFDAPNGDFACVRRVRSNTPLQALTLLNEPLFVECARALASATITACSGDENARIEWAFQRCVCRSPQSDELNVLRSFIDEQQRRFAAGELKPQELLGGKEDSVELATYTALARVLLNLDETVTKE